MKVRRTSNRLYKIELKISGNNNLEKNVAMMEHQEKGFSPRQDRLSSSLNSNLCSDSISKKQLMPSLALSVKSKGEIDESRNLSAMNEGKEESPRDHQQYDGGEYDKYGDRRKQEYSAKGYGDDGEHVEKRDLHRVVGKNNKIVYEGIGKVKLHANSCSEKNKGRCATGEGNFPRDFVKRNNCSKKGEFSRKQIKGEIVGVNLFS
uniref:Uncharacterized protein n=1 Tax=Arundo donax TaxID=35708 RepID=A0A0A9BMA9_ARUDO